MKLSVIMPVWNTAPWLEESLRSVLDQDFRDLELICVDDGSDDGSPEMLKREAERDSRVRVLRIPHGGQSTARNAGLAEAAGEWVYFMDSDDRLTDGAFGTMLRLAEERGADLLLFDGDVFFDTEAEEQAHAAVRGAYRRDTSFREVVPGRELFVRLMAADRYTVSPCLMLARRSLTEAPELRFREGIIYEDNLFTTQLLFRAEKATHENAPLFRRRVRAGSTMTRERDFRDFYGNFVCYADLLAFAERQDLPGDAAEALFRFLERLRDDAVRYGRMIGAEAAEAGMAGETPLYRHLYAVSFRPLLTDSAMTGAERRELLRLREETAALRGSTAFRLGSRLTALPHRIREALKKR